MSRSADARHAVRPAPRFAAGALALGVHALFGLLLVFGLSWQTQQPAPVMVDVWTALPAAQPPQVEPPRAEPPPPEPEPEAVPPPEPEPVKIPEPAPKRVVEEPPPPKAPDIALEKKKAEADRLKELKAKQAAEEKARDEAARAEAAKKAREKQVAEQKKRDLLRQMEQEDLLRAEDEARAAKQAEARAAAASRRQAEVTSVVAQYSAMISAKVRGNTRLPDNLTGNPEVRCLVKLLPTGQVKEGGVQVTKSSGNPAYDEAVVRAIEKSSPLPLPEDRDARAAFVPELSFVHRPK